jgi:hypothetical protein
LDAPTAAIRRIRTELGLPQLPLEEIGSATMINSPSGNEAVINYQDAEGRIYSYDPVLNQVIEIDARARLSKIPTDASALPLIELRNEAKKIRNRNGIRLQHPRGSVEIRGREQRRQLLLLLVPGNARQYVHAAIPADRPLQERRAVRLH